jgi:hypothetical protein
LEVAAVALLAVAVPALARALGYEPGHAFVLAVLNPLVILTIVAGAHNDGVMVALLVAGLALAAKKHPVLGIVVCAIAASIKAPAALGVLYIAWEWLGPNLPVRLRLRPIAIAGIISAAVLGAITVVSGLGFHWVRNLATPGTVRSWLAPMTGLGILLGEVSRAVGIHVTTDTTISIMRLVGLAVSAAAMVWLLGNADRIGWLRALGYSLLIFVVLGPVVQPWYLTWGLLLLAVCARSRLERLVVILFATLSPFVGLPGGRTLLAGILHAPAYVTVLVLLALWSLLLAPLGRWAAWGTGPVPELESLVEPQPEPQIQPVTRLAV